MEDFNIFSIGVEDINTHEQEVNTTGNMMYKPSADDGKDGTYKALIRFVPNIENPRNSLIKKYVNWLTGPNGDSKLIDSPTTIGEHCPVSDAFFRLRKSESAVDRKASDKLKRRESYVALVKIIKDPQQPDLEGTYKVFKFGYKIKEKIEEETKPAFGEPTQIYDLFEGKNFELIITRQGEYNNYDKSKFSATRSAIAIDGKPAERNQEAMTSIKGELDTAPSLDPYGYKKWDAETLDFVNGILRQYLNPGSSMDSVISTPKPAAKKAAVKEAAPVTGNDANFEFPDTMTATPTAAETKSSTASADSDDLDSFLDEIGI